MKRRPIGKSISRIVAVQILYKLEFHPSLEINEVLEETALEIKTNKKDFAKEHKLEGYPDKNYLVKLVNGTTAQKAELEEIIKPSLADNIEYEKLNHIIRFILMLATYELKELKTPFKVVINEYMGVSARFCSDNELRLVNGVLDTIAHKFV